MEVRMGTIQAQAPMKLEGYALVFDSPTMIGGASGYEETILRGALDHADLSDVALFYNHDTSHIPLARTPNTLALSVDDRGLKFSATLPETEEGRGVYESVKRGDLRGCSFAFTISDGGETWNGNKRAIGNIEKIFECSICPFPAYADTTVEARKKFEGVNNLSTMKFHSEAEAFNHYRNSTAAEIERRTSELTEELSHQPADSESLSSMLYELRGLNAARDDVRSQEHALDNAKKLLKSIAGLDAGTFSPTETTPDEITSTAQYRSAFFKTLQGRELTKGESDIMRIARAELNKRASEFTTSTDTAAIIPTSTLNEIISKARTQGGLMAECRAFSVPSKIAIPVATPSDKAAWHVEGAAVDTEKITPTTVTFDGNEILKIFSLSVKTQTMTIGAFESYLTSELQACVMETIEDALINGTGSGQGTGLLTVFDSDNTVTPATANVNIDYSDITRTIAKLKRGYANGAKFAMNNQTLWTTFYRLSDDNLRPLFINDPKTDSIGKILGYDVVIDDHLDDNVIIFGNFNFMAYNLPSGIVVEASRDSSFKSGLIDYRAMAIADCKPILKEAFVKLTLKTS